MYKLVQKGAFVRLVQENYNGTETPIVEIAKYRQEDTKPSVFICRDGEHVVERVLYFGNMVPEEFKTIKY